MKLTVLFTIVFLQVGARGLTQSINFSGKDVPLVKVFSAIKKQTGFVFFYRNDDLAKAKTVSIDLKNASLQEALDKIFREQPLTYSIKENTIVVSIKSETITPSITVMEKTVGPGPQPIEVRGKVVNENGEPVPGVSVTVKGTNNITTTDANGEFSLNVNDPNAVLVFSSAGLTSRELSIKRIDASAIVLKKFIQTTDTVVVVGYGTQRRSNLTGAVDQVGAEYFENRPMPNITRGLQGVIPNLNIRMVDGKPTRGAAYNIRGLTSIGSGGNALVLIDGVPGDPANINPNDVQSVTVLKDAASAAIYGSRGAFGVVLITTKSPRADRVQVNYSGNYSINSRTITPELVNDGYEWAKNFDEAFFAWNDYLTHPLNINGQLSFSPAYMDSLKARQTNPNLPKWGLDASGNYIYYENTDWMKELYKNNNSSMEHSLSVDGGSDRVKFAVSGRYYTQDGIFRYNTDKFTRYNLRVKGEIKVNDWLSINTNSEFSTYNYRYPLTAVGGVHAVWRLLSAAAFPVAPLLNPDGTVTIVGGYSIGDFYYKKSYSTARQSYTRNTIAFTAIPIRNYFTIKGDFSYVRTNNDELRRYFPVPYSIKPGENITSGLNYLGNDKGETNYYIANLYGEYTQNFGNHAVKVLVGGILENNKQRDMYMRRDGLLVDNLVDFNLATGTNFTINGGGNEWANAGIFYRLNYGFKNKYLLTLNGRYDGSSRFPQEQQFGFFPSVSAGWVVTQEKFMEKTSGWLNQLKLRASYGSLGNGNITPYSFLPVIATGTSAVIVNGRFPDYIQRPNVVPSGITWEQSTTLDVGFDLSLFHNRLTTSYSWYQRKTTNMITAGPPLPGVFGSNVPTGNFADLSTKGWDLSITWQDKIGNVNPLHYSFRVALWDNVSRITKFYNPTKLLTTNYEGMKWGEIWGFETEGFFTSTQDIAEHANQSYFSVSNLNRVLPGDIKFKDLNGDGRVNNGKNTFDDPGDQKVIGNASPRYQYSFTSDLSWKDFSVSLFFQGIGKRDWFPSREASFFWGQMNRPYSLLPRFNLDRWTEQNPSQDAYFPRYRGFVALSGTRELAIPQTRYLQNAAYIRLKTVTASYSLPTTVLKRIKMRSMSIYVTGQNLWTYSPMFKVQKNFDPEVIEGSDPEINGTGGDGFSYPMQKSITVGLNIGL